MGNKVVKRRLVIVIAFTCLVTFLVGCSISTSFNRKVGAVETQINNNWKSSFRFFDGSEQKSIHLDEGESLVIKYILEVKKGELELSIIDRDDIVLLKAEDAEGELIYIAADEIDCYININAIDARGLFEITWDVRD